MHEEPVAGGGRVRTLLIAILIAAPAASRGDDGPPPGPDPDRPVLRVGDHEVTWMEYSRYLMDTFGRRAVDRFVTDFLVKREADRRGIEIEPGEVEVWIDRTVARGREDPNFYSWLRSQGLDLEEYRSALLPAEAERQILLEKMIRKEWETEEGLRGLYERRYGTKYRVRVILVRDDEMLKEALSVWARGRIREARTLIEEGEPFEDVVEQYSDAPDRDLGGDLGFFGRGRFDPAIEEAAFSLDPGEIAGPVETDFGYHLVQVLDRRGERVRARHILVRTYRSLIRDEDGAAEIASRLDEGTRQDLTESARSRAIRIVGDLELGADFGTVASQESSHWSASRGGEIPPFAAGDGTLPPEVAQAAMDLEPKSVSEPIRAGLGWYIVRLDGIEGGDVAFDEVKEALREEASTGEIPPGEFQRVIEELREGVDVTSLGPLKR